MDKGDPEYVTKFWNFILGCLAASRGCKYCYAAHESWMHRSSPLYKGLVVKDINGERFTGKTRFIASRLTQPGKWTESELVWVAPMSDLFHRGFTDKQIARAYAAMATYHWHDYIVLTKRVDRAQKLLSSKDFWQMVTDLVGRTVAAPLSNVRFGISVEDQKTVDARMPAFLDTPAACRILSCQPVLGPMDLTKWLKGQTIQWSVIGFEAGPLAREFHMDWITGLRDQFQRAGVGTLSACIAPTRMTCASTP